MWYRYEMHMHCRQASLCAKADAAQMVQAFHDAGYAGAVLTDHFIFGNTAISRKLPWEARMQGYEDAWRAALPLAKKLDFDLLFGFEHYYGDWKEVLVYGIDPDFLKAHPELERMNLEEFAHCIHEGGGYLSHAHPYRMRDYMEYFSEPIVSVCDGIEVYNFSDPAETNARAEQLARKTGLRRLSGSDSHWADYDGVGQAGMAFSHRIHTTQEMAQALQNGEGKPIIAGKIEEY